MRGPRYTRYQITSSNALPDQWYQTVIPLLKSNKTRGLQLAIQVVTTVVLFVPFTLVAIAITSGGSGGITKIKINS